MLDIMKIVKIIVGLVLLPIVIIEVLFKLVVLAIALFILGIALIFGARPSISINGVKSNLFKFKK